jgi:hypothetical protein
VTKARVLICVVEEVVDAAAGNWEDDDRAAEGGKLEDDDPGFLVGCGPTLDVGSWTHALERTVGVKSEIKVSNRRRDGEDADSGATITAHRSLSRSDKRQSKEESLGHLCTAVYTSDTYVHFCTGPFPWVLIFEVLD